MHHMQTYCNKLIIDNDIDLLIIDVSSPWMALARFGDRHGMSAFASEAFHV